MLHDIAFSFSSPRGFLATALQAAVGKEGGEGIVVVGDCGAGAFAALAAAALSPLVHAISAEHDPIQAFHWRRLLRLPVNRDVRFGLL